MKRSNLAVLVFLLQILVVPALPGGEPELNLQELSRTPPTSPAQALGTFKIRPGYKLQLVAAEPLVVDPIAMCFDEENRMYVIEMVDYSERRPEMLGQVRRLEDTDGDGIYDRATLFAKGFPWPTGVFWADGAVWVASTPDIIRCRDTDGDGVADTREVVFTGFANDYAPYETNRLNVQAMLNSFVWGPDNRLHGATSFNGGKVASPLHPERVPVDLRGRDFSFDPRRLDLRAEVGGGQYGMCFDDAGRKFFCSNSDHIQAVMFEDRYAARNPAFNAPPPRASIAVDGPAATVFRISPDEPWRVIRTRWRVSGVSPGLIEGGGRPSGYFTSATGLMVYRGDAWPAEDQGDAIIADCGSNLVHRKKIRTRGAELLAERAADEQDREFLASTDLWFRPVQFANAPDGSLYMADMYREIIEHPWSLPQPLKSHLDLNSGNDRGRIYRIVPDGFRQPPLPSVGKATTAELVALLTHPNGWHRDTAARLLGERRDPHAIPALKHLVADRAGRTRPPARFRRLPATGSTPPARAVLEREAAENGRWQALEVLASLEALDDASVVAGLHDPAAVVRRHAVRLTEPRLASGNAPRAMVDAVLRLARDSDAMVRCQVAFTLGEWADPARQTALLQILQTDAGDRWVRTALLTSLATGAGEFFAAISTDSTLARSEGGVEFQRQLAQIIGVQHRPADLATLIGRIAMDTERGMDLLAAFGAGLARGGTSLSAVDPDHRLRPLFDTAAVQAQDSSRGEADRVRAVRVVSMGNFQEASRALPPLMDPAQPQSVQLAALSGWVRYSDAGVAEVLLAKWAGLTPRVRAEALTALMARTDRISLLLDAVEKENVRRADIPSTDADTLRKHRDEKIRERATRLLAPLAGRGDVVKQFEPALSLQGSAARGYTNYAARCISCHRIAGEGFAVGPDLETVRTTGRDKVLTAILDPNRDMQPNYQAYEIETRDGESLLGVVASETSSTVTLRRAYGELSTVPRSNIASMQGRGQSLMPEGLEAGLTPQDLADLLELILSGPPKR